MRAAPPPPRLFLPLLASAGIALLGLFLLRLDPGRRLTGSPLPVPVDRPRPATEGERLAEDRDAVEQGTVPSPPELSMPVAGVDPAGLQDDFVETRGGTRRHEAVDILAPRGTPVFAAMDGVVAKLFTSVPGGLTVYEFDPKERYCAYYAHLDGYAPGLREGQRLRRGDLIGYVGTTGNAPEGTPHLHFALSRLAADRKWWSGTPIDPYPLLASGR